MGAIAPVSSAPPGLSADLAHAALVSLTDGLCLVQGGRIAFLNPRAATLFGLSTSEWLGRPADDFFNALAAQAVDTQATRDALAASSNAAAGSPHLEFAIRRPAERVIDAAWFPLGAEAHDPGAYGILWRDITREKELDAMKTQLLSTVSHELRTPLASIKGFATTLLRQDVRWDEATQREFLHIIEEESNRLEELIDNLLDMSQLEAGALRISKEPVQLRRVIRQATDLARRLTSVHWFVVDLPAELPLVWADPRRIRQVLSNLLENAIKYSPEGGQITVTCEVDGEHMVVSVTDQGEGIPPEHIDRVFERFFQIDGATTRRAGGSGLGLAIARGLVLAHGGRMWAESQPGQGSVFRFTLPTVADHD
jgi:signal transduction histidine kinase